MSTQQASEARAAEFFAHVDRPEVTERERRVSVLLNRLRVLSEFTAEKTAEIIAELKILEAQS